MSFKIKLAAIALSLLPIGAIADTLPAPDDQVVLRVSGLIGVTNDADGAAFDMNMLKDLPATEIRTTTIWTEGEQVFLGVSLADLLQRVEATGNKMDAYAINDYNTEIPMSDAVNGGPIVAYMRNGAEMSVRNKGPLWVVYPYDDDPKYMSEQIYSRSIWQLDRIKVVNR
ncbi:MAG: molybdopterin-dependent oxidoreductase [Rhodobacteraceae bacterium]|jgi:hypothetical protein|nr:molybdopterin-dependent oxidoreductase [Paracoccaceae bacterium]